MSSLEVLNVAVANGSDGHSRMTALDLVMFEGSARLFSTTRYDGVLQEWTLTSGLITAGKSIAFDGTPIAGGGAGFVPLDFGTSLMLLTGGGTDGNLQLVKVDGTGLSVGTELNGLPAAFEGLQNTSLHRLADGTQVVYGALAGQGGIAELRFGNDGTLLGQAVRYDQTFSTTSQLTDTVVVQVNAQAFLVTASHARNGITARQIDDSGTLSDGQTVDVDDGLWIDAPTAMGTATINGRTYIVLASAGSDSLSVIEIAADGTMIIRDHLMDGRDTRFGGVTALDVVSHDGKTYVIAGGADDGISVLELVDGGFLVHRDRIADTVDITLDNVSAIVARSGANGLDIFVGSGSEAGLTQLRFDTGLAGITVTADITGSGLIGTAGNDILQGLGGSDIMTAGGGDDILRDGAGSDVLSGGAGADVFILSADEATDTITDFTVGEDRIDLSLWPMLRDKGQLFMAITPDGMRITYGDEVLFVQSADGQPIDYRTLSNADLIGGSRLPVDLVAGFAGPVTPARGGNSPEPPIQSDPHDNLAPLQLLQTWKFDMLAARFGSERDNVFVIEGDDLAETLSGGGDADVILAGGGNDGLIGGDGNDALFGRSGNDILSGGNGADTLLGGAGDDMLIGAFGDDALTGGAGADTFVFNAGRDVITDFQTGIDQITLDPRLWTGLTTPQDLLFVYGTFTDRRVQITFDTGDTLIIEGITDLTALADDIALF